MYLKVRHRCAFPIVKAMAKPLERFEKRLLLDKYRHLVMVEFNFRKGFSLMRAFSVVLASPAIFNGNGERCLIAISQIHLLPMLLVFLDI